MKQLPQEIRKNRLNCQRQIGMLRLFFYVATAGSFAAGASDMVDNAMLILYRLYVLGPLLVARSSLGNDRWVDAEAQWVEDNYPWLDTVGKAGWGLLVVGVVLQMFLGIA